VAPSHWIIGGDGWAYDIGFGGLDHVLATGAISRGFQPAKMPGILGCFLSEPFE